MVINHLPAVVVIAALQPTGCIVCITGAPDTAIAHCGSGGLFFDQRLPPRHTGPPDVHAQSRPRDPTTLFGPLSHPVFPAISRPRTSPSPPPSPSIMCKITSWVEDFSTREPDEASPLIACRRGAAMGDSCRAPTGCICARMSGILAQSPTLEVRWVACTACDRSCPPRPPAGAARDQLLMPV